MISAAKSFVRTFNAKLEPPVREHLKKVYGCTALAALSAGVGAYVHMYTRLFSASLTTLLAAVGLFIALVYTPSNGRNNGLRLGYLLGFSFFAGVLLGPLLSVAVAIDPSIIVTALLGTVVIFGSFSLSAIFAERGCWLYLGGILTTVLSMLTMLSLANLFFASHLLFKFQLYVGLLALCAFVLYDTQLIIEKRRHGNKDFVSHALDLFIDFFDIFKSLVFILCEKETQKRNRRD